MKYRTVLLFGPPGSGKGTQGKILGAIPNLFHFSCGDVFRGLRLDSELGKIFAAYSSRGELVPDEPTVRLWREYIEGCQQTGRFDPRRDLLVLDGIPRNVAQARMLDATLEVGALFNLTCPVLERLVERIQRRALRDNRLDDANLDLIRARLETYERESRPLLDHYDHRLCHRIDATQTPIGTLQEILQVLARL